MNKIGMYYSYWIDNWEATYSSFVPMVADLGFDIFEINSSRLFAAGSQELEKLKQSAEEKQIELTYCTALSKDNDISSENAGIRTGGIELLKKNLRLIHDMGGSTLSGVIYGAWGQSLDGPLTNKSDHLGTWCQIFISDLFCRYFHASVLSFFRFSFITLTCCLGDE